MLCLSSLAWLWILLPHFSSPLDKAPPPFPHSHWAVKIWNTVIWNHCLYDLKKKRRACTRFWSKRIIYKIDAAKTSGGFFFFSFFNPKHRVMRNSKETFLNIFLLLTAWLRFVLYDDYLFFFFFALLFSTTSERCHLWTYNSSKNGKDEGHENYNSHFWEQ